MFAIFFTKNTCSANIISEEQMFKGQGINRSAKGSADKPVLYPAASARKSEEEMNTTTAKKYKINKVRMTGSIILIVILISLSAITVSSAMGGVVSHFTNLTHKTYTTVEVSYGDTLWNLAEEYCSNKDVRAAVMEIYSINNLRSEAIYPGQTIRIPA